MAEAATVFSRLAENRPARVRFVRISAQQTLADTREIRP
jgi:hypothetical protein